MINLGVDFGTTNCTVARPRHDGGIHQLGPIPSVGAIHNREVFFGDDARELLLSHDSKVIPIRDVKLLLREQQCKFDGQVLDTTELASRLLVYLRRQMVNEEAVDKLVVGTPINIEADQRERMRTAALQAGFRELHFVYEPTAALIGALDGKMLDRKALALVVDWGGGTLDLSVVRHENQLYRDLVVDGDVSDLGGTRIDEIITDSLLRNQPHVRRALQRVPQGFARLKEETEQEKIRILEELEDLDDPEALTPGWLAPAWLDEELHVDPSVIAETLRRFADRAGQRIEDMLAKAGLKIRDITHILFAGGTCKSRIIRDRIAGLFPKAEMLQTRNPQLLTGIGCARLLQSGFQVELAADVVVREADDQLFTLLPMGHGIELDTYRRADFMITDPHAPEAIFDFGIRHSLEGQRPMRAAGVEGFQSLRQMFISAGRPTFQQAGIAEMVRLHIGINRNLEVAVHALTTISQYEKSDSIQGVPLAIRIPD